MKFSSPFHRALSRDKGVFNGRTFLVSSDGVNWIHSYSISVTSQGQMFSNDENDTHYLLLQSLQACYVQIYPTMGASAPSGQLAKRRLAKKSSVNSMETASAASDEPPVVFVKTYDNEKLYIKVPSKTNFGNLVSCLLVWQALKPQDLAKKWYCENKVLNSTSSSSAAHELLVCRFKVYGPIPAKSKNLNIVNGPRAPVYQPKMLDSSNVNPANGETGAATTPSLNGQAADNVHEGWFYTMGVLKSNGMLNFISELDGALLYSIDVKSIMSSEIREVHHSIFENSNILFLGQIKELRWNNTIKTISTVNPDLLAPLNSFLTKDGRSVSNNQRVLVEFPLHIDLEDWFVGLNYFAKREYIGAFSPKALLSSSENSATGKKDHQPMSPDPDATINSILTSYNTTIDTIDTSASSTTNTTTSSLDSPQLASYTRDNFRVSKKVSIDIIEAKFDNLTKSSPVTGKVYAEVVMWGMPWSRTAIVPHTHNPFWKEAFSTDLPILTQIVHILIKKCSFNDSSYLSGDKLIGTVYITPDILSKQISTSSTMMTGFGGNNNGISVNGDLINPSTDANNKSNDIVRLSVYDSSNLPIGKLLINVNLKEYHILSPPHFKTLESMLFNAPMKDMIKFCNSNVATSDFENVSLIMLDIFQSLGIEDKWFKALMEVELVNVDKVTRKNYVSKSSGNSSSNNVFNTLFRGSSIFSKSLERYNLRIGQEYLEKVFGDFFSKIAEENKNCEVDPRYVRLQEKAERTGKPLEDNDSDDSDEDDEGYDSDVERKRGQKIKGMVEQNFNNLYGYAEEIWNKIYITSNDLPQQIKTQLKNFRTKVDLACDPDDKVTALNCLSAFIFLRFFCPAILNPKLFYLTKNHQTGNTQRTLTLIAKILLNLANRQEFSPHKEPHLVKMNEFLNRHHDDIYDYFDKITGRKNDFNEKILDLSHEVKRFDLGLSGDSTSSELPTTPYLIDKYLRLTELIHLLNLNSHIRTSSQMSNVLSSSGSSSSLNTVLSNENQANAPSHGASAGAGTFNGMSSGSGDTIHKRQQSTSGNIRLHHRDSSRESTGDFLIDDEKNVYQIGSLEFEKSEFLDLVGDNETEGFIKSLCRSNENIFSFIKSHITLKDLQKQSTNLMNKINELLYTLEEPEYPNNYQGSQKMWDAFADEVLARVYVDMNRNVLVHYDKHFQDGIPTYYKKLTENALGGLKLKFQVDSKDGDEAPVSQSFSNNSLGSVLKSTTKNPFKKWLRK